MSYNDFLASVENGTVKEVAYNYEDDYLSVKLKTDQNTFQVPNPKSETFQEFLLKHDVDIISKNSTSNRNTAITFMAIALISGGVILYKKKKSSRLIYDARKHLMTTLTLDDVAGNEEAKAMVNDIITFIQNPDKYAEIGAKMPRGILFYGPPGTGKTLMAKAIAGEAKVPFYAMSGSDFIQTYVGVGASRVRDLFKKAKKSEKAVIFIDEIDTIGKSRGKTPSSSNDERDQTLNALLTEMSGFHDRDGIVIIAATNRVDTLDEALTRPGRFDRQIEIGLPDRNARKRILSLHGKTKAMSDEIDLDSLATSTVSFSGAMLENLLNEAAILAANENTPYIEPSHIDRAFYTVIAGAQISDQSYITKEDREITAFHEAGHALMTKRLLPENYISKVTIIPSIRGAGGFSLSIPKDTMYLTKTQLQANIKILFAGRIAEELTFGKDHITTGASNDIQKASQMLVDYMSKYGMDDSLGIFHLNTLDHIKDPEFIQCCRQKSLELYQECKQEMITYYNDLDLIAQSLLAKETLNGEDIDRLIHE